MKRHIALLSLLIIFTNGFAQPYRVENFNMEHGMSSNYALDITQDSKGYIWIATSSGLDRFDGHSFTVFNKYNSQLHSEELNTLLADPIESKIWIGTHKDGLYFYDYTTNEFHSLTTKDGLMSNEITDLTSSADNGIWITHYRHGIEFYDREKQTFTPISPKNTTLGDYFRTTEEDGQGNLYIGHDGEGLSIVSLKDYKVQNFRHDAKDPTSLPSDIVRAIHIDNNKNIWIGTDKGLSLFNPQKGEFTNFKHSEKNEHSILSDQIYDIEQMKDGSLWICSNMGGVSILNLQGNTFTSPTDVSFLNIPPSNNKEGLSSPNARSILQDSYGNIWISNFRGGIDFISHTQPIFNIIGYYSNQQHKSTHAQVWGLYAEDNSIWIGGENELVYYKDNSLSTKAIPKILTHPQTHINVIAKDRKERLWLGLYKDGVVYYDLRTQRFQRVGDSASQDLDIRSIYEDEDGKIWIGAEQGLYSYSTNWKREKEIEDQLKDRNIHSILRDKDMNLWIGTFSRGINVFNSNNELIYTSSKNDRFPSNSINHLIKDSKGRIWAATREGLIEIPNTQHADSYNHYSLKEGLTNTQVRAIQEDMNGNIWISTNNGISRLDEDEKKFYNYNHHDGIPMGDFMDGSACITSKGIVHFGSQNGICYFDPNELSYQREVSPTTITQFVIYDKSNEKEQTSISLPTTNEEAIELSYKQNTFNISFNVSDFSQSPQIEFSYKLEGLSNEWYNTQGENKVTFRNIPYGYYTFKVRARFRNQEWSKNIDSLHIHIKPPFWMSWYAKLFYFTLICVIVYLLLAFYKRRLVLENTIKLQKEKEKNIHELNDERLRFFTNITHELRTPLTLILGPLEDLMGDVTLSDKHSKKISIIHNSSLRLLNLINHILEFRKTQTQNRKLSVSKGNLANLIQEIGLKYKELNQNKDVYYHTVIESGEHEIFFDEDVINMIVDNLMSNAGKYTSKGDIYLRLNHLEENQLKYTEISVSDTGYGISQEALPHIFNRYYQVNSEHQVAGSGIGLALVKSLAELHEGILSVESTLDVGTTFRLKLLRNNTYPNAVHKENKTTIQQSVHPISEIENSTAEERPIILIVEDNADIREYVNSSLGEVYDIITATSGKEGLDIAQAKIPNVIVSDVMMPIMDGLELCRQLKKDIRTSHIPIVLLTAKNSLQDKEAGYAVGADSYLTKPFSASLLHSRINNILETRKMIASKFTVLESKLQDKEEATSNNSLTRLDNEFLRQVTEIIENNLETEKLDIAFIAEKMCMSHSTLYRKIKGLTEMSANEYIRKIKMRKSLSLMKDGYSISEIAFMLGFSSTAYFRQCFKDEYGMSPTEYQKKKQ